MSALSTENTQQIQTEESTLKKEIKLAEICWAVS